MVGFRSVGHILSQWHPVFYFLYLSNTGTIITWFLSRGTIIYCKSLDLNKATLQYYSIERYYSLFFILTCPYKLFYNIIAYKHS